MARKPRDPNTAQKWFCNRCGKVTTHYRVKRPSVNLSGKMLFEVEVSLDHFRRCKECNELAETLELSMSDAMAITNELRELRCLKTTSEFDRQFLASAKNKINDLTACLNSVRSQCAKALKAK